MTPRAATRTAKTRAERLVLLDTASLYYRAYFGVPEKITAPDGTPVNAVRGLLDMIAGLVTDLRPTRLVACWDDDWRPAFRVQAIPSYKAHRLAAGAAGAAGAEATPDTLAPQVPVIADVLEAFGIARVGSPGYEADDVIGTLVARADGSISVDVITGDRDLFQLVDDARQVRVLYTAKGVRKREVVDASALRDRYGVTSGPAYADFAVLRGDPSDGLPGVPGVGDKTAADLVRRYGDLAGVLAAVESDDPGLTSSVRARLVAAADYLAVAPTVVRVAADAPLPGFDDAVPTEPANPEALVDLTQRWGLASSVERVLRALADVRHA